MKKTLLVTVILATLLLAGCGKTIEGCWDATTESADKAELVFTTETYTLSLDEKIVESGTYTLVDDELTLNDNRGTEMTVEIDLNKNSLTIKESWGYQNTLKRCD